MKGGEAIIRTGGEAIKYTGEFILGMEDEDEPPKSAPAVKP
jgi:hypothetical protein